METPQEIVKRLREAGWSQQEIADAVGVSQTTICRVEWGGRKVEDRERPMVHHYDLVDKLRALGEAHAALEPDFMEDE